MTKAVIVDLDKQAIDRALYPVLRDYCEAVGKEFVTEAGRVIASKTKRHSGDLVEGLGFKVIGTGDDVELEVFNDAFHARFQDEGTGVHGPEKRPIRPKKKKVLRFEIDGEVIFAREVQGAPAIHFMDKGIELALDKVNRRYQ